MYKLNTPSMFFYTDSSPPTCIPVMKTSFVHKLHHPSPAYHRRGGVVPRGGATESLMVRPAKPVCVVVVLPRPSVAVGGLRSNARGGKGSGEGAGDALMVGLRGDEAIHDPGGGREGGGGDGFGVQARHAVIASISDVLRACQAAVVGFRGIERMSARYSTSCSCDGEYP